MSDQEYTSTDKSAVEQCFPNMSPAKRSLFFVVTVILGCALFAVGTLNVIFEVLGKGNGPYYVSIGSIFILLSNIFRMSCGAIISKMKEPKRLIASIVYLISIAATLVFRLLDFSNYFVISVSVIQVLAGVWYLLSYTERGQDACLSFCKTCCSKKTETVEGA